MVMMWKWVKYVIEQTEPVYVEGEDEEVEIHINEFRDLH